MVAPAAHTAELWNNIPHAGAIKGPFFCLAGTGMEAWGPSEGWQRVELLHTYGGPAVPSQEPPGPVPPHHPGPAMGPWGRGAGPGVWPKWQKWGTRVRSWAAACPQMPGAGHVPANPVGAVVTAQAWCPSMGLPWCPLTAFGAISAPRARPSELWPTLRLLLPVPQFEGIRAAQGRGYRPCRTPAAPAPPSARPWPRTAAPNRCPLRCVLPLAPPPPVLSQ